MEQYLTGIEELDREILLSIDLSTLLNLYNISKSSRNLINKNFPEWVKINNPKGKYLMMYLMGKELLTNNKEALLEQLIEVYEQNQNLDYAYTEDDLYSNLAIFSECSYRFDMLNKVFKIGAAKGKKFELFNEFLDEIIHSSMYSDKYNRDLFCKIAVVAKDNHLYDIVNHIINSFPELTIKLKTQNFQSC
jgi:hypothetical protein